MSERGMTMDVTDKIIAYESGELDQDETIDLFQHLLDTGIIHHLQGSYQRVAGSMLNAGLIAFRGI